MLPFQNGVPAASNAIAAQNSCESELTIANAAIAHGSFILIAAIISIRIETDIISLNES